MNSEWTPCMSTETQSPICLTGAGLTAQASATLVTEGDATCPGGKPGRENRASRVHRMPAVSDGERSGRRSDFVGLDRVSEVDRDVWCAQGNIGQAGGNDSGP